MASHSQRPRGERLIIGMTGRIGSGKTTVGKYLETEYGFQYLRYSAVLADWLAQDPESKSQLQRIGWEVMAGGMQAELNRRLIARILPNRDVVVDGLRHPLDYETLRDTASSDFRLFFIASTPSLRFERLQVRGRYEDLATFELSDSHPVEQQIDLFRANASLVINNDGSLPDLYNVVDKAICLYRKEG